MKKSELLTLIHQEREAFERVLEGLTPDQMTRTTVTAEGWSIKDILAHLTAWESELVTALFRTVHGGGKPSMAAAIAREDAWNAERYKENVDRPLERVMSDWQGVRSALLKRLEEWDDARINQELSWRKNCSMLELIVSTCQEHVAEHRVVIEAWRREHGL